MSLKAFHILFVTVCTVFTTAFGIWLIQDFRKTGGVESLLLGIGSLVASVVLVAYGRWFLRKLNKMSYL